MIPFAILFAELRELFAKPHEAHLFVEFGIVQGLAQVKHDGVRAFVRKRPIGFDAAWEPEKGSWHWVNLFASWCGPCKEEIPMLTRWEAALRPKMNLTFLSLDDDERELRKFLSGGNGVRLARWHRSESERSEFLRALGLKTAPSLPLQILVDPEQRVRCIVDGAIEERDFERIRALVQ